MTSSSEERGVKRDHREYPLTVELCAVYCHRPSAQGYIIFQLDRFTAWALVVLLAERYDPYETCVVIIPNVRSDLDGLSTALRHTCGRQGQSGSPFPMTEPSLRETRALALS